MARKIRSKVPMLTAAAMMCGAALNNPAHGQSYEPLAPVLFDVDGYCDATGQALVIPDAVMEIVNDEEGAFGADETATALLQKAALEVAHAARDMAACLMTFDAGQKTFTNRLKKDQKNLRRKGRYKKSKDAAIADVQFEVTRLWREDQAARNTYIATTTDDKTGDRFWARRLATAHLIHIDGTSRNYIASLMDEYDWIDSHRFGGPVSAHAWILIQHADDDPALQAKALARMEPYLKNGGVSGSNYAYLWDRVAVNTGRKQRYGTQPTWECVDGKMGLQPMEHDIAAANKLRKALGIKETVEKALARMEKNVCVT
ncbi:MAG: DUF6624 domain-containing protein [Pseudomonadota bacterium]